jgi:hypothetical protein
VRHSVLVGAAAAIAVALASACAQACGSCRGPTGPGSTLTAPWQRYGVSLLYVLRSAHGAFRSDTSYARYRTESDRSVDVSLALGMRVVPRLEVSGALGYGTESVRLQGLYAKQASLSDLLVRARWDALQETLVIPGRTSPPSLGISLGARIPTGSVSRSSEGGTPVGGSVTSQGLGTLEVSSALDARKTWGVFQLGAVVEGALRLPDSAPDSAIGKQRQLGPRLLGRLLALGFLTSEFAAAGFVEVNWEGPIAYEGRRSPDTSLSSTSIGSSLSFRSEHGFRSGAAIAYTLPIDTLGKNALATASVSFFLGYAQ